MLVRKVDPTWEPSENPKIKVGETLEVTEAEQLIAEGKVVPADYEMKPVEVADEPKEAAEETEEPKKAKKE